MTNAATGMPEKRTQTPSPSPDLIPAKTINRKLTLKLAHQMGALHPSPSSPAVSRSRITTTFPSLSLMGSEHSLGSRMVDANSSHATDRSLTGSDTSRPILLPQYL